MLNFQCAIEKLAGRDSRKVQPNTYLEKLGDGQIGVRYHDTIVVRIHSDGRYTLNTGGWKTVSTRDRICEYSNARIEIQRGNWFISNGHGGTVPFENGMVIDASGHIL
jgi:hypothetical protein